MKKLEKSLALLIALILIIFSAFSAFAVMEPPLPHMTVLGDSIASGYGLEDTAQSYASLIGEEKYYYVSNSAVAGHTTTDLLWVVCHDEEARASLEKSDLVVISIGGNDLLGILANADMMTLLDIMSKGPESEVIKNAAEIAKEKILFSCMEIRSLNPDVPIIIQTLYNPLYAHETYKSFAAAADSLAPIFTEIFAYVEQELGNIYTADVFTAFDSHYKETQDYSVIQADSIHPSAKGHELIAQVILEEIDILEANGIVPRGSKHYYLLGDADASGSVSIKDATLIQKRLAKLVAFKDDVARLCADADKDSEITIKDATTIQKHLALLTPDSGINQLYPYFSEE